MKKERGDKLVLSVSILLLGALAIMIAYGMYNDNFEDCEAKCSDRGGVLIMPGNSHPVCVKPL